MLLRFRQRETTTFAFGTNLEVLEASFGSGLSNAVVIANLSMRSTCRLDVKRPALFSARIVEVPALERKDVCHQVGFGPWSTLCDTGSARLCKSLARRVWWLEIGMAVSSRGSE